ncbi:hypothetical protein [Vibrio aerogenes]|uniref:hypothetical protein n=1 Tax=Vibrio aerogenes TaxID=92172 RepID=UPI001114DF54|nr:hypothetical protein [Vibrio aerogenes]
MMDDPGGMMAGVLLQKLRKNRCTPAIFLCLATVSRIAATFTLKRILLHFFLTLDWLFFQHCP